MVNKKIVSFRIEPYIKEASVQIIVDILVIVLISIVLFYAGFPSIACVFVVVGYLVFALIFHYRVVIQAMIDKWKGDYITETVSIIKFIEEFSFAGDSLGHSHIRFLYPSKMLVCRYKIKVISDHGEKKKVRSVMSFRRLLRFTVLDKYEIEHLQVTYLNRSKILICLDLPEETDKKTSSRKKEGIKQTAVKNAIRFINKSI